MSPVDANGNFLVDGGNTYSMSAGTYYFNSLTLTGQSTLQVDGPVDIYLTGNLDTSGGLLINHTGDASNLRIFKQTWSVIVRVLLPLLERDVRIEPVRGPLDGAVVVAEGCPASTLRERGWPTRGYKGKGAPPRAVRGDLLKRLATSGVRLPEALVALALDDTEGDGVDALLLLLPPVQTVVPRSALVEAWVH